MRDNSDTMLSQKGNSWYAAEDTPLPAAFPDEYIPEDRTVVIHGKNAVQIDGGHT